MIWKACKNWPLYRRDLRHRRTWNRTIPSRWASFLLWLRNHRPWPNDPPWTNENRRMGEKRRWRLWDEFWFFWHWSNFSWKGIFFFFLPLKLILFGRWGSTRWRSAASEVVRGNFFLGRMWNLKNSPTQFSMGWPFTNYIDHFSSR